jgi:hypothetical protein
MMPTPKTGVGVVVGKNVEFGRDVVIWNYVGDRRQHENRRWDADRKLLRYWQKCGDR